MIRARRPYCGFTVHDNYQGRTPFANDMLSRIVEDRGFCEDSRVISECLDNVNLVKGERIPSSQVVLGCDPEHYSSYGVIYQSLTDGRTVTTVEHGDIKDVIANAAVLTSSGLIYNAHIFGYDVKSEPDETVELEVVPDVGEEFDLLESAVTSANLEAPLHDGSAAVRLSEHLLATDTLDGTVKTLLDSATVTVFEHCPMEGQSDITEAIDRVRISFFETIRDTFR